MKFEKLFKKIEKFFYTDKENIDKEKKDKLIVLLEDKIESIKEKIKDSSSKTKKEKLKKQLNALKELRDKM